jgi:NADH:ubiquinone oxidoreductase subunit 4 (subunit M)
MLRFLINPLFNISLDLLFMVFTLSLIGYLYSSFIAFAQNDIKKVIAYSSIAHMNFAMFGLFSYNLLGLMGSFVLMLGHGLTSSALFLSAGILYDRYKTRLFIYYGGLSLIMPVYSILFFIFILSNFGFPGLFNFLGEFLILIGCYKVSFIFGLFSLVGLVFALIYSLFMFNKLCFGPLNTTFLRYYSDCCRIEFFPLFSISLLLLFFGLGFGHFFSFIEPTLIKEIYIFF